MSEAQVLASLNHPHIGAIYGLEESDRTIALVLELVKGPTLADLLAPGSGLQAPASATLLGFTERTPYIVSPDGQRFLLSTVEDDATPAPIRITLNWKPPS